MQFERFVDDIYEAAVIPERWVGVLDQLARLADAEGTLLFAAAPGEPRWTSSEKIRAAMQAWVDGPFYADNPRGRHLVPLREARFLTDLDAFTQEEMDREPFYTEYLHQHGLGWCVGTAIHSPAGDTLVFSIEKARAKGPVPPEVAASLDPLRPHLARAAVLSARLGLERARASVEGLNLIGLPAAVLAHKGRVLAANELLIGYAPDIRIAASDRLEFSNPNAQALFVKACEGRARLRGTGASVPLPRSQTRPPFVAHIVPMRGRGRDIFSGAELLLYLTPVIQRPGPAPEILQALFDLSPAEARVAALIAEGHSVKFIAGHLSVQPNTVRAQLKAVFAKTATGRQAELVSLLRTPS